MTIYQSIIQLKNSFLFLNTFLQNTNNIIGNVEKSIYYLNTYKYACKLMAAVTN